VSGTEWALIGLCAMVTFAIKAAGPVALGGRDLPAPFVRVVGLLAPALLTALIVTNALADGDRLGIGADTFGVLAATGVVVRWGSIIGAVVVAAVVTAALRALGV